MVPVWSKLYRRELDKFTIEKVCFSNSAFTASKRFFSCRIVQLILRYFRCLFLNEHKKWGNINLLGNSRHFLCSELNLEIKIPEASRMDWLLSDVSLSAYRSGISKPFSSIIRRSTSFQIISSRISEGLHQIEQIFHSRFGCSFQDRKPSLRWPLWRSFKLIYLNSHHASPDGEQQI